MNIIKSSEFTTVIRKDLSEEARLKLPGAKDLIPNKGGEKLTLREQSPYLKFFWSVFSCITEYYNLRIQI